MAKLTLPLSEPNHVVIPAAFIKFGPTKTLYSRFG